MTSHKGKSHPFYRAQGWISNMPRADKPIIWPHALELIDKIVILESDEQILALIQLINGIAYQR